MNSEVLSPVRKTMSSACLSPTLFQPFSVDYLNWPLPQWDFSGPVERNDETNNENKHNISATLPGIKKVRIIFVYVVNYLCICCDDCPYCICEEEGSNIARVTDKCRNEEAHEQAGQGNNGCTWPEAKWTTDCHAGNRTINCRMFELRWRSKREKATADRGVLRFSKL